MDIIFNNTADVDISAIPVREYNEQVEGSNAIILADTPQELNYYVPDTGWQEQEMEAAEEVCSMSVVTASEELEEQATQFIVGQVNSLNLSSGEFVVMELNGAHWVSSVEMELAPNSAVEVSITDGNNTKQYASSLLTQTGSIEYEDRTLGSYVKVQCPENAEDVQISDLKIFGKPALYEQVIRELPEDTAVLGPKDENNPLHIYRMSLNQSVFSLADRLLNGSQDLTNHEKIMVFMQFISEWYVGLDNGQHYLALGSYIESCGGYSNVLAALAATQGLDARIINLHNYPQNGGHTVCEIYYDGAWHMYDPTYGAFYTSTPENSVSPVVLSYEELSAGKGNSSNITCVVIAPDRLVSQMSYEFLGPAIYEKANPKGVLSGENPMHYPLSISYTEGGTTIDSTQFDTSRQGISVLGTAYICYMQDWTINGLTPGEKYEFVLSAGFVGGEIGGDFVATATAENAVITQNAQHAFNNADSNSMEWVIEFVANSDTAQIALTHAYQGMDYHYINMKSFEIRQAS